MSRPAGDLLQSDRTLRKPLAIDLFCGLGGWAEGLLAEGYDVVGFDNHQHAYMMPEAVHAGDGGKGTKPVEKRGWTQGCAITLGMEGSNKQKRSRIAKYPAQLVLQDVLTLHGSQFRDAAVIVASPPCQNYSYLAMPWSRSKDPNNSKAAKALRLKWETEGPDNRLFDACFRIQREAIEARQIRVRCGCDIFRHPQYCPDCYIPLIVENVRGAQPWVGRSAWNYGSFYLWGDVPALMPFSQGRKRTGRNFHTHALGGVKVPGQVHGTEYAFTRTGANGQTVLGTRDGETKMETAGRGKNYGGDFGWDGSAMRTGNSRSNARKAASAQIAKIPFDLARHIAAAYHPRTLAQVGRLADAAGKS